MTKKLPNSEDKSIQELYSANPNLVTIQKAAQVLKVSKDTLRRWEAKGKISSIRTASGYRLYDLKNLAKDLKTTKKTPARSDSDKFIIPPSLTPVLPLTPQTPLHEDVHATYYATHNFNPEIIKLPSVESKNQAQKATVKINQSTSSFSQPRITRKSTSGSAFKFGKFYTALAGLIIILLTVALLKTPAAHNLPKPAQLLASFFHTNSQPQSTSQGTASSQNSSSAVLAASSIAKEGKFLQLSLDTNIVGNLAVEGEGVFTENITAPNIVYKLTPGTNISITGDPQNPTISTDLTLEDATNTTKGIASFSADFFTVAAGAVSIKDNSIAANQIKDNAITTAKIEDNAITDAKIKDGSVTNTDLANSSITITAGSGLSGGGSVSLGGSVTLSLSGSTGSGVTSITGTANQIIASSPDGDVTLSLPQDIATTSAPTFTNATFSDLSANGVVYTTGTGTLATVTTASSNLCLLSNGASAPTWGACFSGSSSFTLAGDGGVNQTISSGDTMTINGDANIATAGVNTDKLSITLSSALTGINSIDTIGVSATGLTFAGVGNISSTTTSAITIDSGTTGAVNLGTGNNAKSVNIGTGTAGNTINIGTDNTNADTINVGSALDTTNLSGAVNVTSGTASRFVLTDSSKNLVYSGTSSVLASTLTDETGTGSVVFSNSPTLVTPSLGVATATSINGLTITASTGTLTIANGKVFTVSNSLAFTGTDGTSFVLPSISDDLVGRTTTQTLTNKTIDAGANTITNLTNANLSGSAGITNANLANSTITITGNSGSSAISLGGSQAIVGSGVISTSQSAGTLTISCTTCLASGGSLFTLAATSGSNATISQGGTVTVAAGSDITTTSNGSGTVTIANTSTLASVTARGNSTSTGISLTENGNTSSSFALYLKRNTDTTPAGYLIQGQNAAADTDLFAVDVNGLITTASVNSASIVNGSVANADLANSSITFAGDSGSSATSLGGTRTIAGTAAQGISTLEAGGTITITAANALADGSTKGVAAFNATNFTSTSGVINTVQNIHTTASPTFTGLTISGLSPNAGVYTDGSSGLTSTPPTSGTLGYWSRAGSTLSPSNSGDNVTTSGDISTSGTGAITSAGLLTASSGLTVTTGNVAITAGALTLNGTTRIANDGTGSFISGTTIGSQTFTTNNIADSGALTIKSATSNSLTLDSGTTGTVNLGTGSNAKTLNIGNGTSTTALNLTSGTGAQTFTSSVGTGTGSSSAFVFNASSLSSGTALRVTSTSTSGKLVDLNASNTSGTIFNLAYGTAKTLTGDLTGFFVDLDSGQVDATNQNLVGVNFKIPTVTDTHTSGTKTLTGALINFGSGAGINQTGAGGTLEYVAADLYLPALTQTAGTLNAYGTRVTTPATITTGGTAAGYYVNATGVGAGNLSGLSVSSITAGAGTEYALNIGSGWDAALRVGSTTVINGSGVTQVDGGGTGLSSYTAGDLIYASGATTLAKLAGGAGNNGKVLTVSGGLPVWSTVSGASCTDCVINDPTSVLSQTITPSTDIQSLVVRQTTAVSPTSDIFQITNSAGSTKYFWVDKDGNVSNAGTSSQTLTLTPVTDTTALTLVGTNVTTQPLQYINANNQEGTIVKLNYGTAQTLTNSLTAFDINLSTNLTSTNQSVLGTHITLPGATNTHTSGTVNITGFSADGGSINQNGAGGTTVFTAFDATIPAITQTAGTMLAYGVNVNTPSSITTGGTASGVNINATGVGAGTLNGINIGSITAGAGTENGLQIGSGWDTNLLFNDTTTNVAVANGGTITIKDTAGNSLCTISDSGSAGDLSCTGTISGAGSVGFWTKTGTTLSPATANDIVSISTNSSTAALTLAPTGATGVGLTVSALSGTTSNIGVNIVSLSGAGASSTGVAIGPISSTGTNNFGVSVGAISGAGTNNIGIITGNISGATTNIGLSMGTLTGGTGSNYQIATGAITGSSSTNIGGISVGAISGTGTNSFGMTIGLNTATATNNYGLNINQLSGAGTNNYGLNITQPTGASSVNSAINVTGTITDAPSNTISARVSPTFALTSSNSNAYYAASFEANASSSFNYGSLIGSQSKITYGSSGTATQVIGAIALIDTSGSSNTITNLYGLQALAYHQGSGTAANNYGVNALAGPRSSGNTTFSYGVSGQLIVTGTGGGSVTSRGAALLAASPSLIAGATGTIANATGLQVQSTFNTAAHDSITGGYSAYGIDLSLPNQGGNTSGTNNNYGLYIQGTGGTAGSGGTVKNYSFFNSSSAASYFAGNVGIGTSAPSQIFQVNANASNPVVITSGGNVGVGTTTPTTKFFVGTGTPESAGANDGYFSNSLEVDSIFYTPRIDGESGTVNMTNGIFSYNTSSRINITSTLSNVDAFDISGTLSLAGSAIRSRPTLQSTAASQTLYSIRSAPIISASSTDAFTYYGINVGLTDANSLANTAYGLFVDATTANSSDTTYAAALLGGNVGIGTSAPNNPLEVRSTTSPQLRVAYDTSNYFTQAVSSAGVTTLTATGSAPSLNLQSDGTTDVNLAGGSSATGCTVANSTGNLTCTGNITGASTGTAGYWQRNGTSVSPATITDNVGIGTTAPSQIFQVNANASNPVVITSGGNVGIGTTAPGGRLDIASTVTSGADLNIANTGVYTGTGILNLTANSATTGTLAAVTGNGITSGKLLNLTTSSSSLTTGSLISSSYTGTAAFTGNLNNLDYSPASTPSTSPTGDLLRLNLGSNASNFTGNIFNIVDNGSSVFSVSKTAFNTSLPSSFTAAGDVSVAYDINFTNPTASYIKSYSGLTIQPGDSYGSSNLTLSPYNEGSVYIPSNVATAYGLDVDANSLSSGRAADISSTSTAGTASGNSYLLYLDRSGANANTAHTAYGLYSSVTNTNATSGTNIAGYFSASGATTANYGLLVAAGNVGIGTTAPSQLFAVGTGATSNFTVTSAGNTSTNGTLTFGSTGITTDITLQNSETIDNDTDNQINLGLGSSGTLKLTSSTTATIANSAGALAINATATGLNLQADGSVDVNLAGGSSATGCTLANSTGNLTCTGNITGASTGTLGYWSRSGTTLSPATSNDVVSIATTNTTGADLALTNTGVYTGTGIFNLTANSATTGNLASLTGTGLTTGEVLNIDATYAPSNGSTNEAIDINLTHAPTASADNFRGLELTIADATALDNTILGINSSMTISNNANKVTRAVFGSVTSSSTTADTLNAGYFTTSATGNAARNGNNALVSVASSSSTTADNLAALYGITSATGVLTSGNRFNYGIVSQPASTAASTGGSSSIYGLYANPSSTLSNPGVTDTVTNNVFGVYTQPTLTIAADCGSNCVSNQYGIYVDNGTSSTNGTSTKYGIYVAPQTGADGNYGGYFGSNVGIGNATPTGLLEINGAVSSANLIRGSVASATTTLSTDYGTLSLVNTNSTANNYNAITFSDDGGSLASGIYGIYTDHTNNYGDLGFVTRAATIGYTEKLRITGAGNVGIGTTTPGQLLDLYETTPADNYVQLFSAGTVAQPATAIVPTTSYGMLGNVSTTAGGLWVAGFSDTAGGSGLVLDGTIGSADPTDSIAAVRLRGYKSDGSTGQAALGNAETVFQVLNSTTPVMTILGNGNVGIGTTAPDYPVEINTGSTRAELQLRTTNTGGPVLRFRNDVVTGSVTAGMNVGAMNFLNNANSARAQIFVGYTNAADVTNTYMSFSTTGAEKMRIDNLGNVGIGNTAPAGKLDVLDTSNTAASFTLANNTATTIGNGANTLGVIDLQSTSLTTGNFMNIELNALTSGKGINLTSTSTALTTGSLFNIDYSPASTTATGDLSLIHLGSGGTAFAGNLFNIKDDTSSIFSVSKTAFTTSLPSNFTAAGDVAVAYDINFTNPTASYIKSAAPLNIYSGETFNSSNLNLGTYNQGTIVFDTANTTTTALDLTNTTLTTGVGLNISHSSAVIASGGSLQRISSSSVDTGTTTGILLDLASTGSTAGTQFLQTHSALTTGTGQSIVTNALTSGRSLSISSSTTGLTSSGALQEITLSGSNAANAGSLLLLTNSGTANTNTTFTIQHNATGTGNLAMRVNDVASDTTPFVIDGTGNVGIGTTAPTSKLHIVENSTTTSQYNMSNFALTQSADAGGSAISSLVALTTMTAADTGSNDALYGIQAGARYNVGSGTLSTTRGIYLLNGSFTAGGTISQNYGIDVPSPINTGTVTDNTAIFVEAQTTATNNIGLTIAEATGTKNTNILIGTTSQPTGSYSIYNSSTDQNYFAGNVGIGNSTPATKLEVGISTSQTTSRITGGSSANLAPVQSLYRTGVIEWTTSIHNTTGDFSIGLNPASYTDANLATAAKLTILSNGNVGIGTTAPTVPLTVSGGATAAAVTATSTLSAAAAVANSISMSYQSANSYTRIISLGPDASTNAVFNLMTARSDGSNAMTSVSMAANGDTTFSGGTTSSSVFLSRGGGAIANVASGQTLCYNNSTFAVTYANAATCTVSSARFKHDIASLDETSGLDEIMQLRPVSYVYNGDQTNTTRVGLIAEELNEVDPRLVVRDDQGRIASLSYEQLTAVLTKGIQQLNQKVDNALLTIGSNGQVQNEITANKVTVTGDVKVGGIISASKYTVDASSINRVGSLAAIPVTAQNQVSLADAINSLNQAQTSQESRVQSLEDKEASSAAALADAKVLGEQALSQTANLSSSVASTSASIANLSAQIDAMLTNLGLGNSASSSATPSEASPSDQLINQSTDQLALTPPTVMFASDSAKLDTLTVNTEATISGKLTAYEGVFQNSLKSLGATFLGKTNVAGDLTVDGTFTVTEGSKVNALPILYFQSSPLAEAVDFFNGLVTITKDGLLKADKIMAKEVIADQITVTNQTAGTAILKAGTTEIPVFNNLTKSDSIIVLTPETVTNTQLAVSDKVDGSGFVVKVPAAQTQDINFSYIIVGRKAAQN